jgi:aminodeoxychorismate synthase component I
MVANLRQHNEKGAFEKQSSRGSRPLPFPMIRPRAAEFCALDSPLSPPEVAAGLRHLPGLVFFDTAGNAPGAGLSLVAADPVRRLRGSVDRDWAEIVRVLGDCAAGDPEDGMPRGILAGAAGYGGAFDFGLYPEVLVYSHAGGRWWGSPGLLRRVRPVPEGGGRRAVAGGLRFEEEMGCGAYCRMVERALEYIAAGDIYQVNLSRRFLARWGGDPFDYYRALRDASPTPYAAFLDLGGVSVASASPELFLSMSGRRIETRPIKGTRPRRPGADEDDRSARELVHSEKENAELVMITDLERNDLGQVCEFGSVTVPELARLERYEQVYHLVSTVAGTLREGVSHPEAFRACFPGGSITGAPKKRAREIIAELEPVPRGFYTGSLGYFGFNGESRFNIAIRTAVFSPGAASFHVGAGIVADSDPAREFDETGDKAAGLLEAARRSG